jgi:hypothetical protein
MEDDGSALRVGAKYKSFTDLERALKKFQQDNYVQLYKRNSRKIVRLVFQCIRFYWNKNKLETENYIKNS